MKWHWIDLVLCYVGSLVLYILLSGLILKPVQELVSQQGYDVTVVWFLSSLLLQAGLLLSLVWLIVIRYRRCRWQDIGLVFPSITSILKYGVVGGMFLAIGMIGLSYVMVWFQPNAEAQGIEVALRLAPDRISLMFLVLAACVVAPLSEEIFFRGLIYTYVRAYLPTPAAMALSGLIFGLVHFDLLRFLPVALGGILLCYFYEKSGSIWVSILGHSLWNGIMVIAVLTN